MLGNTCLNICVLVVLVATTANTQAVIPTPIPDNACNGSNTDIIFVLDTSGSIGQVGFNMMIDFVRAFIDKLDISPDGNGVGIITYSRYPIIRVPLAKYSDKKTLFSAIDSVPYIQGVTGTHTALILLAREGFKDSTNGTSRVAIVVTDGRSIDQYKTEQAAVQAKSEGIVLFSVGIGVDYDLLELNKIGSTPTSSHVYTVSAFANLKDIVHQLSFEACLSQSTGLPPTITPPTAPQVVTTAGITSAACNSTEADIFFLVDTSVSMRNGEYDLVMQYIVNVVNQMDIGPNATQVGLITFSDYATVRMGLGEKTNKLELVNAILNIPNFPGDATEMIQGLELVMNEGFLGDRPDVPNIVVIITDGKAQNPGFVSNTAKDMHEVGIVIFSVGIGHQVSRTELRAVASQPSDTHTVFVNDFASLTGSVPILSSSICTDAQSYNFTPPTTSTVATTTSTTVSVTDTTTSGISTTPKPTGQEACVGQDVDVFFLVDSSGSVNEAEYNLTKEFVKTLVGKFDVSPQHVRVGLIAFSTDVHLEFGLSEYNTTKQIQDAVTKLPYYSGGTNTAGALELLRTGGFLKDRPDIPNVAIVLTDGVSKDHTSTRIQARLAKEANFTLLAIGIGDAVDMSEITDIASPDYSGNASYAFHVQNFNLLNSVSELIAYISCGYNVMINPSMGTTSVPVTPAVECNDTVSNCESYGRDICNDYEPWARAHCGAFCGFCKGPVTPPPICKNKLLNCHEYGTYICTSLSLTVWTQHNCPQYCGFCGGGTPPTEPPTRPPVVTEPPVCKDLLNNCHEYGGEAMCHDPVYSSWARHNCREYCAFCSNYRDYEPVNASCPKWHLPIKCSLENTPGSCCPLPKCPDGYVFSALSPLEIRN